MSDPRCEGRRLTVRLPGALCEELKTLVEEEYCLH
jgi:hypothetical protein